MALEQAIALGKGRGVKEPYFFDLGLFYFDKDGNVMPVTQDEKGNDIDPKTLPNYDHTEPLPFQAGRLQYMPTGDKEALVELINRREFARPDMQDKIDELIGQGFESYDLIAEVDKLGGLVTLADFGLEAPTVDSTGNSKKKGG